MAVTSSTLAALPGAWSVRPLAGVVGAWIEGADLRTPLEPSAVEALHAIIAEYGVLFFPRQGLEVADHLRFARQLGEPKPPAQYLPALVEAGYPDVMQQSTRDAGADRYRTDQWHSDVTWMPNPPRYSILSMRECPDHGGDTMWSSQVAAYDQLSARMKQYLVGLQARHGRSTDMMTSHPVVIEHPLSRRRALFVNGIFTRTIADLPEGEATALLSWLLSHAVQPELVCRWRWCEGDLAVWDNHFVQHYAIHDYAPAHRTIHRIEIMGESPIPATTI